MSRPAFNNRLELKELKLTVKKENFADLALTRHPVSVMGQIKVTNLLNLKYIDIISLSRHFGSYQQSTLSVTHIFTANLKFSHVQGALPPYTPFSNSWGRPCELQ